MQPSASTKSLSLQASLLMLAGGAMAETGDLALVAVSGGMQVGAVSGDELSADGSGAVFPGRWLFSPLGP